MKFIYCELAGQEFLDISSDMLAHIKALRLKPKDRLELRNLKDEKAYLYEIISLQRRQEKLELVFTSPAPALKSGVSLGWAVIEPKVVQKSLPFLNELGVEKISFFYADFSQKNYKLDLAKLKHICALSAQQCGRGDIMSFEIFASLDELLELKKNVALLDFNSARLDENMSLDTLLLVGPEGGFSQRERELVSKKYSLNTPNILRSQTAMISVAAKLLA